MKPVEILNTMLRQSLFPGVYHRHRGLLRDRQICIGYFIDLAEKKQIQFFIKISITDRIDYVPPQNRR